MDENNINDVIKRNEVIELAEKKDSSCFDIAISIRDSWYKCQAFSTIAKNLSGDIGLKALTLAKEAASSLTEDPYKEVAVSSWPISILVSHNRLDEAKTLFFAMLEKSNSINYPGSKAEALILLFQSIYYIDKNFRLESSIKIINLLSPPIHWRQKRAIKDIVEFLNYTNPEFLDIVKRKVVCNEARKVINKAILKNEKSFPRQF